MKYLLLLDIYSRKNSIQIIAYALMEWHIHIFLYDKIGNISNFIKELHGYYARAYNYNYNRTSHVFGGRFKNKIVDANNYGVWLTRYIHRQAIDAGIVNNLCDYRWTSFLHYIGEKIDDFIDNDIIMKQLGDTTQEQVIEYSKFMLNDENGPINWEEAQSNSNLVIGNRTFIKEIAAKLKIPDLVGPDIDDALKKINTQYDITIDDLRYPQNRKQRALRRRIICYLSREYGIGTKQIAELLNVSVGLVSMVLNNKYI